MDDMLAVLAADGESTSSILRASIPVVLFVVGGVIAVFGIIMGTMSHIQRSKHVEESRREIAAYVAEGSISPVDAERLIAANPGGLKKDCESCGTS
ncbi:MAG: hypothetical protein AAFR38_08135 [Planctomycetota bacterium]